MIDDLHRAACAVAARHEAKVRHERAVEAEGVGFAVETKSAHSNEAWKIRHKAELRLRAARAVAEALAEELNR